MKKIMALVTACLLLTGCAATPATPAPEIMTVQPSASRAATPSPTPQPSSAPSPTPEPLLSEEDYPRVDGSTATIPLGAALLARACGLPLEEAELFVEHNKTSQAYLNLLYGNSDLLLVYEPPQGAYDEALTMGSELEELIDMQPIGRDALVFLTNADNPVSQLSQQQIVSIYQDKIKNWREIGGDNAEIAAFQRDPDSGSQTLMKKLVMGEAAMAEAPSEQMPGDMGGLIESLKAYDNSANALGYSVYYYVQNMIGMENLKMLAVDGVEPNEQTISGGQYPYTNVFYVAVRKDEPEGSPARVLYEFLLSDQGKELISDTGYVALR